MGLADKGEALANRKERKTPGAANSIETKLDELYYAVLDKKSLKLSQAAHEFNISLQKTEEWAKLLDKQGLIEIYYPAIGEIQLRSKEKSSKKTSKLGKNQKLLLFTAFSITLVSLTVFTLINYLR